MTAAQDLLSEDDYRELSSVLWSYRTALRRVEFLLEAQLIFARSGHTDALGVISDLLEETATTVCQLDLRRELVLPREAEEYSLADIAANVSEPWSSMFLEHRDSIAGLAAGITKLTEQCRRAMGMTLDLIDQLVSKEASTDDGGYDRRGRTVRSAAPSVLFDSRA